MLSDSSLPAVANEDSGINLGGGETSATTTTTATNSSTIKRTAVKTEGIKIPTMTTKIKVDTIKMTTLCEHLDGSLMQIVDDTREDDLFISRLQEELLQSDEKWENQVTKIAEDVVSSKKEMTDQSNRKELEDLKDELDLLQNRHEASQREKEDLHSKLRTKRSKIEELGNEMNNLKQQMEDERVRSDAIERQLDAMQKGKEDTDKDRMATMVKVSTELFKYRNKRVPEVGELKDLHELIDRIHHSLGYLLVLGQQPSPAADDMPHASSPKAEPAVERKPSISSAL